MQRVKCSPIGDRYVVTEAFRIRIKPTVQDNGSLGIHLTDCSNHPLIEAVKVGRGSAYACQPFCESWITGTVKTEFAVWVRLVEWVVGNNRRGVHEPVGKIAPEVECL